MKDILETQKELNTLLFRYIQFLMAFIPDKDLVTIYEERPDIFCKASKMSEEELLQEYNLLKLAVTKLESWLRDNYNITLDFTDK